MISYTKNDKGSYDYKPNSSVLMTEFVKLAMACTFFFMERSQGEAKATFDRNIFRYAVPALLYAIHNNLVFLGIEALDAPTYQLLNNIKIVVVGFVQRIFLRRPLTVLQWLGIALLTIGQAVATLDTSGGNSDKESSLMAGIFIMVTLSFMSAFAGVYNEFLLKESTDSIHFQNIQMYGFGMVFCFAQHMTRGSTSAVPGDTGFFHGFTISTWISIFLSAFMGQSVSFVLKYADNITNRFATAASLLLTVIGSNYLFGTPITLPFCIGIMVLGVAFALYYAPPQALAKEDWEVIGTKASDEA